MRLLALPAELYPHILLCTPECFDSIPCFFEYVNYFFKNFYTKFLHNPCVPFCGGTWYNEDNQNRRERTV